MGNALGQRVDGLLEGVLEAGSSAVQVGVVQTTYTAENKKLCPLHLASELTVTGAIDSLKVTTPTLSAAFSAAFRASAPQLKVEAHGLRLRICAEATAPSAAAAAPKGGRQPGMTAEELVRQLGNLALEVQDVTLELVLGGHRVVATLQSLRAKSSSPGRYLARWQVEHSAALLHIDGCQAARACDGGAEVLIGDALRRVDASLKAEVDARIHDDQLLALLNVSAAAAAAAAAVALGGRGASVAPGSGVPFGIRFRRAKARLDLASEPGDPLLEVGCQEGRVSITPPGKADVHVELVRVKRAGASAVDSPTVSVQADQQSFSLSHGFQSGGEAGEEAAPWTGVLDLLLADPRFAQHRAWLERARDAGEVAVSRKRPLEEEGGGAGAEKKRSRS